VMRASMGVQGSRIQDPGISKGFQDFNGCPGIPEGFQDSRDSRGIPGIPGFQDSRGIPGFQGFPDWPQDSDHSSVGVQQLELELERLGWIGDWPFLTGDLAANPR
jgi:hypothetical protein